MKSMDQTRDKIAKVLTEWAEAASLLTMEAWGERLLVSLLVVEQVDRVLVVLEQLLVEQAEEVALAQCVTMILMREQQAWAILIYTAPTL